jgi:hypothetical protein
MKNYNKLKPYGVKDNQTFFMKKRKLLLVLSYSKMDEPELRYNLTELDTMIGVQMEKVKLRQTDVQKDKLEELENERWIVETILNELVNK